MKGYGLGNSRISKDALRHDDDDDEVKTTVLQLSNLAANIYEYGLQKSVVLYDKCL